MPKGYVRYGGKEVESGTDDVEYDLDREVDELDSNSSKMMYYRTTPG